jgi:hypothetical protein
METEVKSLECAQDIDIENILESGNVEKTIFIQITPQMIIWSFRKTLRDALMMPYVLSLRLSKWSSRVRMLGI